VFSIIGNTTLESLAQAQRDDSTLEPYITYMETGILPISNLNARQVIMEADNFVLEDGILLRVTPTVKMIKNNSLEYRICIPLSMRADIIRDNHDHMMAGHLGLKKTYSRISEKYFWFGMYSEVREWVRLCKQCGAKKGLPNPRLGIPHSHLHADRSFQVRGADMLGPLPTTKQGNRYILVFTDHFSKWVEVFPLKETTATTIAKHYVEDVICRFGAPEALLCDRGNNFIGQVMIEVNKLLQIQSLRTAPYHPQTNGLTERFNKTLCTMLSMYVSKHQSDWDEPLPYVAFAYRTAIHSSTNRTPFEIVQGRNPVLPNDLQVRLETNHNVTADTYVKQLQEKLTNTFAEVQHYEGLIRQKRETDYQRRNKEHQFNIGDQVWLYNYAGKEGLTHKLQ
jgi:hypothetical protein